MNLMKKMRIKYYFNKLKNNKIDICNIDVEYLTEEVCFFEIKRDISYFFKMPKKFINQEICDYVFNVDFKYFEFIPDNFKNQEMCNRAIKHDSNLFKYVPIIYCNDYMFLEIINSNDDFIEIIDFNVLNNKLKEIYFDCMICLPYNDKIKSVFLDNLDYLKEKHWIYIVINDISFINFLPVKYQNIDFYKQILFHNTEILKKISDDDILQELFNYTLEKNSEVIFSFPKKFFNWNVVQYITLNFPDLVSKLPKEYMTASDKYLNEYLITHVNDDYTITIGNIKYQFRVKDIITYLTLLNSSYKCFIRDKLKNIPVSHFESAVLSFYNDILVNDEDKLSKDVKDNINFLKNSRWLFFEKGNNPFLENVYINQELIDEIFNGLDLEKSLYYQVFYIYIKMCKILTYDEEFFAQNQRGESKIVHQDINHLMKVTPHNNEVVCYEFISIFEFLLNYIGITCEIYKQDDSEMSSYGEGHIYLICKLFGSEIKIDPLTSIFSGDLFSAKLNLPLVANYWLEGEGLHIIFNDAYRDISMQENNNIPFNQNFADLLKSYSELKSSIGDNISLNERVKILINKVNSVNFKGIDCYAYLLYLKRILFSGDLSNKIDISIIRDNTLDKTSAISVIVIKQKKDDGLDENFYYMYKANGKLKQVSLNDLQMMFDKKEISYISENDQIRISGIRV